MPLVIRENKPPRLSIGVLSMLALAYEILLMRLFSIIQWHHFAYMIISLALLGYGASGTFLFLARRYLLPRYSRAYLVNLLLFGISSMACYLVSQHIPFNAEEILWDLEQAYRLMIIYILLALPFFFVANAIGLTLMRYKDIMTRIYSADLLGAGLGSLLIISLLFLFLPTEILRIITALAFVTTALAAWELVENNRARNTGLVILISFSLFPFLLPASWTQLEISPYKSLSQTLQISGTHVVSEQSSPLGMITVVESPRIPFRHAPGLSLLSTSTPPEQYGIFTDGDAMTAITRYRGNREELSYLDQLTSALPYHLGTVDDALILGSGGGQEILQARYHQAKHISAVELDRQIIDLLQGKYRDFSGHIYDGNDISVFSEEARGFVSGHKHTFDLIQLTLVDSYSASSAGLYALSESYLYTTEALRQYLAKLNANGYLAISRWVKLPPRDTLKLFATAVDALRQSGVRDPGQHLVLIRGLQTSTLVIKNTPVTPEEITALRGFCKQRSFDVAYYPGIKATEANKYNILARPYFYEAAQALLGPGRDTFMQQYKFNLEPATDDKPFFFHFFKWQTLPEILSLRGKGGMPLLEWGYLILITTLVQAIVASVLLILLPLLWSRRRKTTPDNRALTWHTFVYFLALGLAFLFVEIAYIQKFILFLHHPVYATAVVLAAFLIFAGLGSAYSARYTQHDEHARGVIHSVLAIALIGGIYTIMLGPLFALLLDWPVLARILVSILLIAPLAFSMGIPFPVGLSYLGVLNQGLVPWAWSVNGCASVLSAVLATLLAIHLGFTLVIVCALLLYAVSAVSITRWQAHCQKYNPGALKNPLSR